MTVFRKPVMHGGLPVELAGLDATVKQEGSSQNTGVRLPARG